MLVHPKLYNEAIKHINKGWPNGCLCKICKAVDKQENIVKVK